MSEKEDLLLLRIIELQEENLQLKRILDNITSSINVLVCKKTPTNNIPGKPHRRKYFRNLW